MISKWYGKDLRLGVLGGGQLGRMLIQAANDLNIHIHCLDPDPNAPCSEIAHSFSCGSLTDYNTVLNFGSDKHLITVEIENVNVDALVELEKKGVKVFPQSNVLKLIQDKGLQKEFYKKNKDSPNLEKDFNEFIEKQKINPESLKNISESLDDNKDKELKNLVNNTVETLKNNQENVVFDNKNNTQQNQDPTNPKIHQKQRN